MDCPSPKSGIRLNINAGQNSISTAEKFRQKDLEFQNKKKDQTQQNNSNYLIADKQMKHKRRSSNNLLKAQNKEGEQDIPQDSAKQKKENPKTLIHVNICEKPA